MVGPGAVCATLAASLLGSGLRVVLVGREGPRLRSLRREGLSYAGVSGRARILRDLEFAGSEAPRGNCEALFLCVKSRDIPAALRSAAPLAGPKTAVVSLLNGIDHAAPILRAFGRRRTVLGSCYFAAMRPTPDSVRLTGRGPVALSRSEANPAALAAPGPRPGRAQEAARPRSEESPAPSAPSTPGNRPRGDR